MAKEHPAHIKKLVADALADVDAKKAKGWTKTDFAAKLKQMLESDTGDPEPHPHANMTEQEIVDSANALARLFYKSMGYEVPEGYRFDEAHHPQEVGMWNLAVIAFEHIAGTDIENALANLD